MPTGQEYRMFQVALLDGDEKAVQQFIQNGGPLDGIIRSGQYGGGYGYGGRAYGYKGFSIYKKKQQQLGEFLHADLLWMASSLGHAAIVSLLLRQGLLNKPSKVIHRFCFLVS